MKLQTYALIFILFLTAISINAQTEKTTNSTTTNSSNNSAPEFNLTSINGKSLKLSALRGKVVVMNLWFTGCPPCLKEIPLLNKLVEKFKNEDVVFIAPSLDDEATLQKFLKEFPFKYNVIANSGELIINTYGDGTGNITMPTHIVIDKEGNIAFNSIGGLIGTDGNTKSLENLSDTISRLSKQPFQSENSAVEKTIAFQYFQEQKVLCKKDTGKLWGVSLCSPLLFVEPNSRSVIANQADNEGILTKAGDVFVGKLPANINIANTSMKWAGVNWSMIIFPLPNDKFRRNSLMAHESWHRIQNEIGFPSSSAANNHLDSKAGRVWIQLEWRALAKALSSFGKEQNQAIADALLFRKYRRSLFPNSAEEERGMEMHEGLAEYTGVKLSGSPNLEKFVIETNLKEAADKETFVRSFAYVSVPAYGLLLDKTNINWQKNLKKEDDLGNLLQKTLSINLSKNIKQAAQTRAKIYDGGKLQATETERENKRRKTLAEYRAKFIDGAVLEIPLEKMNMQFDPNNLQPLENFGTVYANISIIDVWGILTVNNGALINSTFSKIYVAAENQIHLNTSLIKGDGWILELNDGWKTVKAKRERNYSLERLK